MSDPSPLGVLYTEHLHLRAQTPLLSLWSYESHRRERGRPPVLATRAGQEFWLAQSDPLLNTILPGTAISVIFNLRTPWASGQSLIGAELMPAASLVGPFTRSRLLRVGTSVGAVGAVLPATLAPSVFGCAAGDLVDRIVPLADLWKDRHVDRLHDALASLPGPLRPALLRDELTARVAEQPTDSDLSAASARLIIRKAGRVSIRAVAAKLGLSRQQFARRFRAAAGVPPKQFARIARFQALVHVLLSTDVAQWATVAPALGFFDQAHMINEFRAFTSCSPTIFFRPHGDVVDSMSVKVRGRPHEWLRQPDSGRAPKSLLQARAIAGRSG